MHRQWLNRLSASGWIIAALAIAFTLSKSLNPDPKTTASCSSSELEQQVLGSNQESLISDSVKPPASAKTLLMGSSPRRQEVTKANACPDQDPFNESVRFALKAANLVQTAKSKAEWDEVARYWVQAVAWMQAVPPNSSRRVYAEKKVIEYMRNLAYAQQQAAKALTTRTFPSFNSEMLDQQLPLYLSYLSTVGKPDVLIVGSSRALQGIDPKQMQQSLAVKGFKDIEIFNLGINGATAQVVDYILRQLLTPEQLPQIIVWADGVRAFNSGRIDRTYNAILESEGNKRLASGIRPQISQGTSTHLKCYQFPQPCKVKQPKWQAATDTLSSSQMGQAKFDNTQFNNTQFDNTQFDTVRRLRTVQNTTVKGYTSPQLRALVYQSMTRKKLASLVSFDKIEANGFLPFSTRYNPETYHQKRPYVAGAFDGDYQAFNLGGEQSSALSSLTAFLRSKNIPLVFVNLPVTDDYLDGTRWAAEVEFQDMMNQLSMEYGFIFIDLSEKVLTRYEYFVDPSHLNLYGARAVAQRLVSEPSIPWPKQR
ncbi:MAG: hypothetical protein ACRC8A_00980 [Microcoleaceae cyanobacterium]